MSRHRRRRRTRWRLPTRAEWAVGIPIGAVIGLLLHYAERGF